MFQTKHHNAMSDFRPLASQGAHAQTAEQLVGGSPYGKVIKFSSSYPLYTFNAMGNGKWSNADSFGNLSPDEAPSVNVVVDAAKSVIPPVLIISGIAILGYIIFKILK